MNNEKQVLLREDLSTTTLEDLDLTGLNKKQQKQAALEYFLETQKQLAELDISADKKRKTAKAIQEKLKLTEPVRKVTQLKKEIKQDEHLQEELRSRYAGALGVLSKLGLDISKELKNLKLIESHSEDE